jgi:hypothetical protein
MSDYAASPQEKKEVCWPDSEVPRFVLKVLQTTIKCVHYGKVQYPSTSRKTQWNSSFITELFPTIAHSEDRAVIAYMISQGFRQKKSWAGEKWLIISAISDLQLVKKGIYFVAFVGFLMYENGDIDRAYNT